MGNYSPRNPILNGIKGGNRMGDDIAPWIIDKILERKWRRENPPHLPDHASILFKKFKRSYECKNFEEFADTLSEDFSGNTVYGRTKAAFLRTIQENLSLIKPGFQPNLAINVDNIVASEETRFAVLVHMSVDLDFLLIPTPMKFDSERLFLEAKPEGQYNIWRITKLNKY